MSVNYPEHFHPQIYDQEEIYYEETIEDIWDNCVLESVKGILPIIVKLILSNFLFGVIVSTERVPEKLYHILSGCTGLYLLLSTLDNLKGQIVIVLCFLVSYLLLSTNHFLQRYSGIRNSDLTKVVMISCLVLSEYCLIEPEIWIQVRGILMILTMKVMSLSHDYENSEERLNLMEYFGYTFCGANILFGPWISYKIYYTLYTKPTKKSFWWIFKIFLKIFISLLFLTISNCWALYFIPDHYNEWSVAYREALSFRTSHYFICYLSEASMLSAGFKDAKIWYKQRNWSFTVTNPIEIEFPSALANVVTNWNKPMHEFLKRYVFKSWLPYGKFAAVFATFVMSSFLHGFELKVSVVLITIGIFSYLQIKPREIVSDIFSCCVKVRPCKNCNHVYKRYSFRASIINFIYSVFTILHLAYLGILMDSSTDEIGIYNKWKNLHFISHLIMIIFNLPIVIIEGIFG